MPSVRRMSTCSYQVLGVFLRTKSIEVQNEILKYCGVQYWVGWRCMYAFCILYSTIKEYSGNSSVSVITNIHYLSLFRDSMLSEYRHTLSV